MRRHRPLHPPAQPQRGIALVIALIFLLLMTMIGVSAIQGTTMQERMASNMQDRNTAFQGAEAALRAGELWLFQGNNATTADTSTTRITDPYWDGKNTPAPLGTYTDITHLAESPVFHVGQPYLVRIDLADPAAGVCSVYPVVARSVGRSDTTVVTLKTHYELVCDR